VETHAASFFLVDRLEQENQANKTLIQQLKNDLRSVIYKENRDDWRKAEIVVTTVQSLLFNNLVLFRPIFSPTDFIQIKDCGTRRHDFTDQLFDPILNEQIKASEKTQFKLFDFFANCEYFEEKFNYDEIIIRSKLKAGYARNPKGFSRTKTQRHKGILFL